MGAPVNVVSVSAAAVNVVTTAETVVATLPALDLNLGQTAHLEGMAIVTLGTAATAVRVRIRRGTTAAGAELGTSAALQGTAANTIYVGQNADDVTAEQAAVQYVLTVAQTAATGNGTVVYAYLLAIID